jgi:transketolase
MPNLEELQNVVVQVRRDIVRMVHKVNSGHPGGSLGCTEFLVALYYEVMELKEQFDMDGKGEDLFFLSNGHISPLFYSVLARRGYFPVEELTTFRLLNTRLQGHPTTHEGLPGVRVASGSLGQGMSVAIGAALAKKLNGVATIDHNGQQIDGATEDVLPLGDLKAKFEVFGWDVLELKEGNNLEAIIQTLKEAKKRTGKAKPVCIIMHTVMGHGVDFMMHTHAWHGKAPNDEQLEIALNQNPVTLGDY